MSVVIVGGNERMVCQYKNICQDFGYKAKVFAKMTGNLKKQFGNPDLVILFTNTASHKLVGSALQEANRNNTCIMRSHSSSSCALKSMLNEHTTSLKCSLC